MCTLTPPLGPCGESRCWAVGFPAERSSHSQTARAVLSVMFKTTAADSVLCVPAHPAVRGGSVSRHRGQPQRGVGGVERGSREGAGSGCDVM